MSLTLAVWLVTFGTLLVLAFTRGAVYGLALYLLTFFVNPLFWWWGNDTIGMYRWNLASAVVFAISVLLNMGQQPKSTSDSPWPQLIGIAFLANVTFVHFFLAPNQAVSLSRYSLVVKIVILFIVFAFTVYERKTLRIALWAMTIGAAYIGYETTINGAGQFRAGRLQGVGAAGVQEPNELAALMAIVLPLAAGLFFTGSRREKFAIAALGPLILNVVLLCNSRGTFLALIAGAVVFLVTTHGPARKTVLKGFALGAVALFLLLGDPEITERFLTVFANEEERDSSATYRLVIWGAALQVLNANPLGAGGDGFNRVYSRQFLETGRSVHNGYLSEAVEWGVQGIALKLLLFSTGIWLVIRTMWRRPQYDLEVVIIGASLITSMVVLLCAAVFADFLDDEWGYWLVALMLGYARSFSADPSAPPTTVARA